MLNNIENNRIERGRTSWSSYAWMTAESAEWPESGIVECMKKLLKDFTEARTVVVASVQATIYMLGIAMVNWDISVDKVTL
jgi:hypothetical protein